MIAVVMLSLLWGAAIYRIAFTVRHELTLWRAAFTGGITMAAVGATLWVGRRAMDEWTGVSNLGNLLCHLAIVGGITSSLVYVESLRHDLLPRRQIGVHSAIGVAVALAMVSAWLVAPLHDRSYEDLGPLAEHPAVAVYSAVFYVFVSWSLIRIAVFCFSQGCRREDPARTVSLILTGSACSLGALTSGIWTVATTRAATGSDPTYLSRGGDVLLPIALTLLGLAILALLVAPWLLDVVHSYARLRALRPAWRVLTELHPEVRLRPTRAWSPRTWLEIRERRTVIELEDAQRLQRLHNNNHPARPGAPSEAELSQLLETADRSRSRSASHIPAIPTEGREQ